MADKPNPDAMSLAENRDKPKDAVPWLNLIEQSQKAFETYDDKVDKIEREYGQLEELAKTVQHDRELKIFWANMEILGPSIYGRPPQPNVSARFQNKSPLVRKAAEVLERAAIVCYDMEDIDYTMKLVRDDLMLGGRGVPWIRFETWEEDGRLQQRTRFEHVDRRDFRHAPARKWSEVPWVARRSWLTWEQGNERFKKNRKAWKRAEFKQMDVYKEVRMQDFHDEDKAAVWEIWHKAENKVVWVSPGVDEILDQGPPHLKLDNFFPCPRPAYSGVIKRTLVPLPDFVQYQDQLAEINELTARISSLAESLRLKGFYPAGMEDVGQAIERVLMDMSNRTTLIGVKNFAAIGGGANLANSIVWLPVREVALVIRECVELRRQMIEDVYQVVGISDIMRGATEPDETLGAQRLKANYGSIRLRDKQEELVRVARDATRIALEIMAEEFDIDYLLTMAQVDDVMTREEKEAKIGQMQQRIQVAMSSPQVQQLQQRNPKEFVVFQTKLKGEMDDLAQAPTVDDIEALFKAERMRPFVLDIETDSTVQIDENAEKQRRTEYIAAVGTFAKEMVPVLEAAPRAAPLMGEMLKFLSDAFKVGRPLDDAIDDFVDTIMNTGAASMNGEDEDDKGEDPREQALKMRGEQMKMAGDLQKANLEIRSLELKSEMSAREHDLKIQTLIADLQQKAMERDEQVLKTEEAREDRQAEQFKAYQSENQRVAKQADTIVEREERKREAAAAREAVVGGDGAAGD